MFAYCNNNPVNNYDPNGLWTINISLTASAVFFFGISLSIGLAFDGQGNFDLQFSYAVPGVDDTGMTGLIGAGVGAAIQYTEAETVYDLYGPATYTGASVGPGWYVSGDAVSFSEMSDSNSEIDGVQIGAGIGVGVDVHVVKSNTVSLLPQKNTSSTSAMKPVTNPRKAFLQAQFY